MDVDIPDIAERGPSPGAVVGEHRPLSARSVVASTLLGMDPPRLPTRILVGSGARFGIAEGATRTAISRLVAAGELQPDGDGYALAGRLLDRHARQEASRRPSTLEWDGRWEMAVVVEGRRTAAARAELRTAMRTLHLAELREGLWTRPANLDPGRAAPSAAVVAAQCNRWSAEPLDDDPVELSRQLWDLGSWAEEAQALIGAMRDTRGGLEAGDVAVLAPTFVVAAAVVRHLLGDPLLPTELVPDDWPADELRRSYERYHAAFVTVWRDWYRSQI